MCNPALQLETAIAYLEPTLFANFFSKRSTTAPWVIKSFFRILLTSFISNLSINCLP